MLGWIITLAEFIIAVFTPFYGALLSIVQSVVNIYKVFPLAYNTYISYAELIPAPIRVTMEVCIGVVMALSLYKLISRIT